MALKDYFDLNSERWNGWEPFDLNTKNIRKNKGRTIAYVDKHWVDRYRGCFSICFGILEDSYYSKIIFENQDSIDKRDILACVINMSE